MIALGVGDHLWCRLQICAPFERTRGPGAAVLVRRPHLVWYWVCLTAGRHPLRYSGTVLLFLAVKVMVGTIWAYCASVLGKLTSRWYRGSVLPHFAFMHHSMSGTHRVPARSLPWMPQLTGLQRISSSALQELTLSYTAFSVALSLPLAVSYRHLTWTLARSCGREA